MASLDIISNDQVSFSDASQVGGKALGLAKLAGAGVAIPSAWVLTGSEAESFDDSLVSALEALGPGPFAVRSSAIGEDGAEHSFAGQFDTVLNVSGLPDLLAAIDTCLNSLTNQAAEAYQRSSAAEAANMAVIIQAMVPARWAGVCFTADPVTNRRNLTVIDVVSGLGDRLVSGETTPDHFELELEVWRTQAENVPGNNGWWCKKEKLDEEALPTVMHKVLARALA